MSRIAATFARLRAEGRTGLIPFVTVGYPDLDATLAIVPALVRAGAELVELGIPFSEAMAEGRGKAQADALRKARRDVQAKKLAAPRKDAGYKTVGAPDLRKGDVVLVEAGDIVPGDGTVIEGVASVDESAITGESAPVIRESGGDRSAVTGGTRVLSDWLVVEIAVDGVQRSTRYSGGVALRFARVVRYRPDKDPADADLLSAVRALGRRD